MKALRQHLPVTLLLAVGSALTCAWLLAQPLKQPAVGQVNPQINNRLYNGGPDGSVRYAQSKQWSQAMPSELRYQYVKSGALPSDIRMNYAELGPLNSGGPSAYIPAPGASYMPKPNTSTPSAMGSAAYSNASVRYSSPSPAPVSPYSSARPISNQISPTSVGPAPINSGAIRYGR